MLARLKTIAGYGKGNVLSLDGYDEITVGRVNDSTIQVKERDVSRSHCRIERFGAVWRIRDLKSHNGTFVNDEQIDVEILKRDDKIKVGNTLFQIELLPGGAIAEDAAPDSPVEDTVDASSVDPFDASTTTTRADRPAPQTAEMPRASWLNPIVLFAASFVLTIGIGCAIVTMTRADSSGARTGDSQTFDEDEEDEADADDDLMKL